MYSWFKKIVEFLLGIGRKRHFTIARWLIFGGLACFAAPHLWVQLSIIASESLATFYSNRTPSTDLAPSDYAGFACIPLGVAVFWFFELREALVIEGEGGVNIGIPPDGASLGFMLERVLSSRRKPVLLEQFPDELLEAILPEIELSFPTIYDAVCGLVALGVTNDSGKLEVSLDEKNYQIIVSAKYV